MVRKRRWLGQAERDRLRHLGYDLLPNATITREQLAKMLYGYTVYAKGNTSYQAPAGYTDFDQISGYAIQAMCWAVSHGVISGDSATTLSPQKYASRAQAASIFVRYLDKLG